MRYKALRNDLYAELTDNVLGVSDWVFSQRGDEYLTRYRAAERSMRELAAAEERFARRRDVVLQVLFAVTAALLLVWAGSHFGGQGADTANWIAAFVLGFFPLIDAFAPLSASAVDAFSYGDSLERLNELPDADERSAKQAAQPCAPLDMLVEGVTYAYPGSVRPVLKGMQLEVPAGQKVAILGRSGAGKSTLASLMRGDLAPDEGRVTLGGVPTRDLGDDACAYIGVIQQRVYLFNMTLLENVRIGRPDASVDEVRNVLEQVGLRDMVDRLPDGLDTMVDEAGLRFSGGERQRIALARVLLQDAPVVILDEPCVGLDPLTEQALLSTLFKTLADRTVIMITHHLLGASGLRSCSWRTAARFWTEPRASSSERVRAIAACSRSTGGGGCKTSTSRARAEALAVSASMESWTKTARHTETLPYGHVNRSTRSSAIARCRRFGPAGRAGNA